MLVAGNQLASLTEWAGARDETVRKVGIASQRFMNASLVHHHKAQAAPKDFNDPRVVSVPLRDEREEETASRKVTRQIGRTDSDRGARPCRRARHR